MPIQIHREQAALERSHRRAFAAALIIALAVQSLFQWALLTAEVEVDLHLAAARQSTLTRQLLWSARGFQSPLSDRARDRRAAELERLSLALRDGHDALRACPESVAPWWQGGWRCLLYAHILSRGELPRLKEVVERRFDDLDEALAAYLQHAHLRATTPAEWDTLEVAAERYLLVQQRYLEVGSSGDRPWLQSARWLGASLFTIGLAMALRSGRIARRAIVRALPDALRRLEALQGKVRDTRARLGLIRALPDILVVLDGDGRCLDWYEGEGAHPRPLPRGAQGFDLDETMGADAARPIKSLIRQALLRQEPVVAEHAVRIGDRERSFEIRMFPLGVNRVLLVGRDVTQARALERLALEAEDRQRRRLGRALRESVGLRLSTLGLLIQSLADILESGALIDARQVGELERQQRLAAEECRRLSAGLSPVPRAKGDLAGGLTLLCAEIGRSHRVECALERHGELPPLPETVVEGLVAAAWEALLNAAIHSHARTVGIILVAGRGFVELIVQDDGVGIADREEARWGRGFRAMDQHCRRSGAKLQVDSQPGQGAWICLSWQEDGAGYGIGSVNDRVPERGWA